MKKDVVLIAALAIVKFIIQMLGNRNYGFHRDELLHLSVSEHLDWGYYEFPPFIAFLGKLSYILFDYSLLGVRLFPTIAGVIILILCCQITKELGGKMPAIFFSGFCVLAFIPFYRNHTLFQPVAFDQLFWTAGFYFVIRFLKTNQNKYLLLTGITLGLGLLTKYTILIWALGLLIGLLLFHPKLLKKKSLYLSGLIVLIIFFPNLIWQIEHNLPIITHLKALKESQLEERSYWTFIIEQAEITPTFLAFLWGVGGLLLLRKLQPYSAIGLSVLVIFLTMFALKSKSYYVFSLYPVVFAAGTVTIESLLDKRINWVYAVAASVFLPMVYFIPEGTPILPIDTFIAYKGLEEKNGRYELTNDYADMFDWEEQVKLVDSVYQSLNSMEQKNCVIWAENYGEAGAIKILGDQHNLPNPISRHGSFWQWGYDNPNAEVWISLGNEKEAVEYVFEDVRLIKMIYHPFAIDEENGIPLYICRKPKVDISQWWKDYESRIFQ